MWFRLPALFTLLIGLVILFCTPFLFISEKGSQLFLNQLAKQIPGLEISRSQGTLNKTVKLHQVRWRADNGTLVTAKQVALQWTADCLWNQQLCFDALTIEHLLIEPPVADPDNADKLVVLPPLTVNNPIIGRVKNIVLLEVASKGEKPFQLHDISLDGEWRDNELRLTNTALRWDEISVNGDGNIGFTDNYPIKFAALVHTRVADQDVMGNVTLAGDLEKVTLTSDLSQPVDASVSAKIYPLSPGFPFSDTLVSWRDATLHLNDNTINSSAGKLHIAGTFERLFLSVNTDIASSSLPRTNVKMFGELQDGILSVHSSLADNIESSVQASGELDWTTGLRWNGEIDLTNFTLPKELASELPFEIPEILGAVDARANITIDWSAPTLLFRTTNLNATASINNELFSIIGNIALDADSNWRFDGLTAMNATNHLYLDGAIGDHSSARLEMAPLSLTSLLPATDGALSGIVSITGPVTAPDISAQLQSDLLSWGDIQAVNINVQAELPQAGAATSEFNVSLDQLMQRGTPTLQKTQLSVHGTQEQHRITLAANAQVGTSINAVIDGQTDWSSWQGTVQDAQLLLNSESGKIESVATLNWDGTSDEVIVGPHCWKIDAASVCLETEIKLAESGRLEYSVQDLSMDLLSPFLPVGIALQGVANSTGAVQWQRGSVSNITLATSVEAAQLSVAAEGSDTPPLQIDFDSVRMNANSKNGVIATGVELQTREFGHVRLNGKIDTLRAGWPIIGELALTDGNVGWVQAYLPQLENLRGKLTASGTLSGSITDPHLSTELTIGDANFFSPDLGLQVELPESKISITNSEFEFSGNGSASGAPISLAGNATIGEHGLQIQSRLSARQLPIETPILSAAELDAELQVTLRKNSLRTTGSIQLNKGTLEVHRLIGEGVAHSSDVVVIDKTADIDNPVTNSTLHLVHDVNLKLGDNVRIEGFGINAQLKGELSCLIADNASPQVHGLVTLENGSYRSYGQNLTIREGRLNFIGPPTQAAIYVEAVRKIENFAAGLRLEGSLQSPTTTLFSEPALPEEEILSYIVMGRSLDQKSDRQAQLLANAALYVGLKNGDRISSRIKNMFGIKDFYINASGEGDSTRVLLSGRLTNRLLLRYGIGIFEPVNTLYLRYDLAERLYIETTRGIERAIDFYYSFLF